MTKLINETQYPCLSTENTNLIINYIVNWNKIHLLLVKFASHDLVQNFEYKFEQMMINFLLIDQLLIKLSDKTSVWNW